MFGGDMVCKGSTTSKIFHFFVNMDVSCPTLAVTLNYLKVTMIRPATSKAVRRAHNFVGP